MLCFKWKQVFKYINFTFFKFTFFQNASPNFSNQNSRPSTEKKREMGLGWEEFAWLEPAIERKKTYLNIEKRNFEAKREKTKNNIATKKTPPA